MEYREKCTTTENPVVQTTGGQIRGISRDGIALFRGIPYGDRCDGEYRFLPPRPVTPWDGVYDCTKNGPLAVQPGNAGEEVPNYFTGGEPEKFGVKSLEESVLNVPGKTGMEKPEQISAQQDENCLIANVLTPGLDQNKRPVLVYIHGGGFTTGSGIITLGADRFAKEHDIVVCSLHHRLNVFGFLYLGAFDPKYESSGIAGMLDLVLGLQWIHENIAVFGGDPDKVTIMGESGGGMKLCTLLNMPETRGLYRGAIIESGAGISGADKRNDAADTARNILERLGISENETEKLCQLSAQEILGAAEPYMHSFSPVPDQRHLRICKPGYAIEDLARELPVIVGSSEDEMQGFCFGEQPDLTWENLNQCLRQSLNKQKDAGTPEYTEEKIDDIIRVFKKYCKNDPEQLYWYITSFSEFLGNGAYYYAKERAEQGGAPIYAYLNAFDAPVIMQPGKRFSWHVSDLPLQLQIVSHPECEKVSQFWSDAWAAFIRTGNPSTEEHPWPAYTREENQIMVVDEAARIARDYRGELLNALEK